MVFKVIFWQYIIERWTQTKMVIRTWSRCPKGLLKCSLWKITWELAIDLNISQSIICCHLKKKGKVNKLGVWVPHILNKKNKKNCISITHKTSFKVEKWPVSQEYPYRWWKMGLLWQWSIQKTVDWQRQSFVEEKL